MTRMRQSTALVLRRSVLWDCQKEERYLLLFFRVAWIECCIEKIREIQKAITFVSNVLSLADQNDSDDDSDNANQVNGAQAFTKNIE